MAVEREHIIRQALEMFLSEGIKSVRMDDIAQRLGISKRTLYEMFGDKETLLYETMICFREQNKLCYAATAVGARDVLEEMFLMLGHLMEGSSEHHRLVRNLQKFYPAIWEKFAGENQAMHRDKLRDKLQDGIREGLLRSDINVELAISILYATATALTTQPAGIVIPEGMSEQEAFVQTLSCFFRGISTKRGEELIDQYMQQYKLK